MMHLILEYMDSEKVKVWAPCISTRRSKGFEASEKKVALVALHCSAAFDRLEHSLLTKSLEIFGAGPKMIKWTESRLRNREYLVVIKEFIAQEIYF